MPRIRSRRVADLALGWDVPLVQLMLYWLGPWALFVYVVRTKSGDVRLAWTLAAGFVIANYALLFRVLLQVKKQLSVYALVVGFMFTFLAVIGAYASADYAASHQMIAHYQHRESASCYRASANETIVLKPVDAIYFTLSTVTTAGFGDIAPHSSACRWLTSTQLAIAFPLLGLSIAGVAARLFQKATEPRLAHERRQGQRS